MNQENQETMSQNQNQTETKVRRFKHTRMDHYQEFVGENGTYIYPDGRREMSSFTLEEVIGNPRTWVEVNSTPASEPKPKPMTIREAAKALKELPSEYHSKCFSVAVEINNEGKVRCKAMHDFNNFSGPNFESVLIHVKAAIAAKNSAPESEADRIIDL